jgi:hypothetical protein
MMMPPRILARPTTGPSSSSLPDSGGGRHQSCFSSVYLCTMTLHQSPGPYRIVSYRTDMHALLTTDCAPRRLDLHHSNARTRLSPSGRLSGCLWRAASFCLLFLLLFSCCCCCCCCWLLLDHLSLLAAGQSKQCRLRFFGVRPSSILSLSGLDAPFYHRLPLLLLLLLNHSLDHLPSLLTVLHRCLIVLLVLPPACCSDPALLVDLLTGLMLSSPVQLQIL